MSVACDPAEGTSPESYTLFKRRLRETIRRWVAMGAATWWGAFDGERLVGQCGFVVCGDLGRFQGVETHPDSRRRGVCSSLIRAVARDGFLEQGCRRVLLEADRMGPALGLYERIGFRVEAPFQSLVRPSEKLHVRGEITADHAAVRSLNEGAFEGPGEAGLVEALRRSPAAISLVAVQSGAVVGHILFTGVTVGEGDARRDAVALGPMAVRPDRQGEGVGTELMRVGLDACRAAGHEVCFVLGHPGFYPRAGFVPAASHGLTCKWPVPPEVFMVAELVPDALSAYRGLVSYHPAFDTV